MLCVVLWGISAAVAGIVCLFLDECIGFSMLNEVVVVDDAGSAGAAVDAVADPAVDAVEVDVLLGAAVDAWIGGSRSSLDDGVDDVILMRISLLSTVFIDGVVLWFVLVIAVNLDLDLLDDGVIGVLNSF